MRLVAANKAMTKSTNNTTYSYKEKQVAKTRDPEAFLHISKERK
jgi:hypothetical protein